MVNAVCKRFVKNLQLHLQKYILNKHFVKSEKWFTFFLTEIFDQAESRSKYANAYRNLIFSRKKRNKFFIWTQAELKQDIAMTEFDRNAPYVIMLDAVYRRLLSDLPKKKTPKDVSVVYKLT